MPTPLGPATRILRVAQHRQVDVFEQRRVAGANRGLVEREDLGHRCRHVVDEYGASLLPLKFVLADLFRHAIDARAQDCRVARDSLRRHPRLALRKHAGRVMIAAELHPLARAGVRLRLGRHRQASLVGEPPREILALMLEPLVLRVMLALLGFPRALSVRVTAAPDARAAVVHAHCVAGDSIEQRAIVRDDDADAAKPFEAGDQQIARFDVKMIGRFVEHQHRGLRAERRANLPSLALARRQRGPSLEIVDVEA